MDGRERAAKGDQRGALGFGLGAAVLDVLDQFAVGRVGVVADFESADEPFGAIVEVGDGFLIAVMCSARACSACWSMSSKVEAEELVESVE